MKKILSIGIIRGILLQIIGSFLGAGLMGGIRALMGLPWKTEPAIVLGGLIGAIFFIVGLGAFNDWWQVILGNEIPDEHNSNGPEGIKRYFGFSLDHKVIGIQYGVLSMFLLSVGGSLALIFRTELAQSGLQFLTFVQFNTLVGLHGMVLIVSILTGIAAVSNYVVPLLIGADDMAFPRLNAFSFWIAVPASLILLSAMLFGGFETGWTAYPPLSVRGPMGIQMFFLGVYIAGWSSILGSLNLIVTIIKMRVPGMTLFRMPIFVWAVLATSIMAMTATQLIGLSFQLVMFERLLGMSFFTPANGGNPVLFQHLFWFYSHPAVYIFILPGLGLSVNCCRYLFESLYLDTNG